MRRVLPFRPSGTGGGGAPREWGAAACEHSAVVSRQMERGLHVLEPERGLHDLPRTPPHDRSSTARSNGRYTRILSVTQGWAGVTDMSTTEEHNLEIRGA